MHEPVAGQTKRRARRGRSLALLLLAALCRPGSAGEPHALSGLAERFALAGHAGEIYRVAFVPGAPHLLVSAGYRDKTVRLWDLRRRIEIDAVRYDSASSRPRDVAVAPDGRRVFVLLSYGAIRGYPIEDARFGEGERYWSDAVGRHGRFALSRRGTFFAIVSRDRDIVVANTREEKLYQPYLGTTDYRAVAFGARDSLFAAADGGNRLALWDVLAQQGFGAREAYTIEGVASGTGTWDLAFSRDGSRLATAHVDGHVTLWRVDGLQARRQHTLRVRESAFSPAFSPDGSVLAAAAQTGAVHLWDTASGRPLGRLDGGAGSLLTLAVRDDGAALAAGSLEGPLVVWRRADP